MRLVIASIDDRATVAAILVKNGYTVRPGKAKRTPAGKSIDYFLEVEPSELMKTQEQAK